MNILRLIINKSIDKVSVKCLIFLNEKIDSDNASDFEKEVFSAYVKNGDLASKIWTVFINKVMNNDETKIKELEEKLSSKLNSFIRWRIDGKH